MEDIANDVQGSGHANKFINITYAKGQTDFIFVCPLLLKIFHSLFPKTSHSVEAKKGLESNRNQAILRDRKNQEGEAHMISSESNAQIKELVKLQKNARHRRRQQCFVVEGVKLVGEAAEHGRLERVFLSETMVQEEWKQLAGQPMFRDIPEDLVEIVTDPVFSKISDTVTPQGILGLVKMPGYTLEEILSQEKQLFLLLDDLRDPGNLGTILRTAEGAGISGVILSRESVDLFNPKTVRATMGAIFRVPFVYVENLAQTVEGMKERGISVYGTRMEGSQIYDQPDYRRATALVIGNEANGISQEVLDRLTGGIRIPMEGSLESLNAAVAAAIVMYEAARQRRNT